MQNSIVSSFLKEDCKSRIEDLIECLMSVEKHITKGDITISDLKILIENKANFFNAVGELPNINLSILKRAFGMREQELNEYVKSLEVVTQFTTLCHRFEGNLFIIILYIDRLYLEAKLKVFCKITFQTLRKSWDNYPNTSTKISRPIRVHILYQ